MHGLCKGGSGEDEGMGPLRSPWGGYSKNEEGKHHKMMRGWDHSHFILPERRLVILSVSEGSQRWQGG